MNATIAIPGTKGVVWHYLPDFGQAYVWEVVRFEPTGNRTLGIYGTAPEALDVFRRDVEPHAA